MNPVIMISNNNSKQENTQIKIARSTMGCKGIILFPSDDELYNSSILELALQKFPLVLVDRKFHGLNLSTVSTDHYRTFYNLTRYLKENNYKKIVYVNPASNQSSTATERLNGFEDGLMAFYGEIKAYNVLHLIEYGENYLINAFASYLTEHSDTQVLILNSGYFVVQLVKAAKQIDETLLNRISLACIDDETEDLQTILNLESMKILQNTEEIGYTAVEILSDMIQGKLKIKNEYLPAIIKGSPPRR